MRWHYVAGLVGFLVVGCANGVLFNLESDEPVVDATLTLNGQPTPMERGANGSYAANWNGADADGTIDLTFADGSTASCRVGYVTGGMEAQKFVVEHRKCSYSMEPA